MTAPLLTSDLPGTGGVFRQTPEDFRVEEIPLYLPSGEGSHCYLRVRKTGIATQMLARRIARVLGVGEGRVGYAGLKDTHAVAEQTFSVEGVEPGSAAETVAGLEGVEVLSAGLHRNKLKLGHLTGNRFELVIREVVTGAGERARAKLGVLARQGCPNLFGEQRFGNRGDNDVVGRLLVTGDLRGAFERVVGGGDGDEDLAAVRACVAADDPQGAIDALPRGLVTERRLLTAWAKGRSPEKALSVLSRSVVRLLVSAFQSHLFNQVLDRRFPDLGTLEVGDLAFLHGRGAVFAVEDPAAEQPRADRMEISPSAPLPGVRTPLASGRPGEIERDVLAAAGVTPKSFRVRRAGTFRGVRRPLRIPVGEPDVNDGPGEGAITVSFTLPPGSYATVVLAEIVGP